MLNENGRYYLERAWDSLMTVGVICGILAVMAGMMIAWIVALLNALTFSYLGYMVGDMLFQDQTHVFGVWLAFVIFTLYVVDQVDKM